MFSKMVMFLIIILMLYFLVIYILTWFEKKENVKQKTIEEKAKITQEIENNLKELKKEVVEDSKREMQNFQEKIKNVKSIQDRFNKKQ